MRVRTLFLVALALALNSSLAVAVEEQPTIAEILNRFEVDPTIPDAPESTVLQAAEALIENGYAQEGADLVTPLLDEHDPQPRAHFVRGWAEQAQGNWNAALHWYGEAEENGESSPELHFNIGVIRYQQGFYEFALKRALRAREAAPQFTLAWQLEGESHLALSSFHDAEIAFTSVIVLDPENPMGYIYRGYTRLQAGSFEKAREDLDGAIRLDPESPWLYLYRADAATGLHDTDAAMDDLAAARQFDAPEEEVLVREADVFLMRGRPNDAVSALEEAVGLQPNNVNLRFELAKTYERAGDIRAALSTFDEVIRHAPEWATPYNHAGLIHYDAGEYQSSIAFFEKAIELAPSWSLPVNNVANAYREIDEIDRAIALYRQAIELSPEFALAYKNLARLYFDDLRDLDAALVAVNHAIELNPTYTNALMLRSHILTAGGWNRQQAETDLVRALEINPESAEVQNELGKFRYAQGRYRAAAAHFRKALQLDPDDHTVTELLAGSLRNLGLTEETESVLENARRTGIWTDRLEEIAETIRVVTPVFAGTVRGWSHVDETVGDVVVALYRQYGSKIAEASLDAEGEFSIPLQTLPGDTSADTWFAAAMKGHFVIRLEQAGAAGTTPLYEQLIAGREITRYHTIDLP